jgi:hypothetical protein
MMLGAGQRYRTARRRVPTSASGTSPRERTDAVWAGFEIAGGGVRVTRACSARLLSGLSTRPRAQRSAKSAVFYACGSMRRASRKRTRAQTWGCCIRYMPEGACPGSNSCSMGRGARARHRLLQRWPSRTHLLRCSDSLGPLGPLRESKHHILSICHLCED